MINELRPSLKFSVLLKILTHVDSKINTSNILAYRGVMFHKMRLEEHEQ